jgi:hypothetical protein
MTGSGHTQEKHSKECGVFLQCAPSATTNCGCFWAPGAPPTNDSQCLVGHYNGTCATCNDHLECGQYLLRPILMCKNG